MGLCVPGSPLWRSSDLKRPHLPHRPPQVYSSGPLTLAGFSPYHTRTAEILGMGPLSSVTQAGLDAACARFGRIEQRFGR